jgi:hypothetical protein
MDILAFSAQLDRLLKEALLELMDKSKIHVLPQDVLDNTQFNLLLTEPAVEDARTALGQDKFQINQEQHVSTDHSLFATVAQPNYLLTDTHVSNAHRDKLLIQIIDKDAIPQDVPDNMPSKPELITSVVEDAKIAHGQHKFQMHPELLALPDHLLHALDVPQDNLMIDTHAKHAQQVWLLMPLTHKDATDQLVLVNMLFNWLSMQHHVVDARTAHGQDKFQINQEQHVLPDHSLTAQAASLEDQMMDIHASNAQPDRDKTQLT